MNLYFKTHLNSTLFPNHTSLYTVSYQTTPVLITSF